MQETRPKIAEAMVVLQDDCENESEESSAPKRTPKKKRTLLPDDFVYTAAGIVI